MEHYLNLLGEIRVLMNQYEKQELESRDIIHEIADSLTPQSNEDIVSVINSHLPIGHYGSDLADGSEDFFRRGQLAIYDWLSEKVSDAIEQRLNELQGNA